MSCCVVAGRRFTACLVAILASALSASSSFGQFTWSNTSPAGGNWSAASNWGGTGPTAGGSATTTLTFGAAATQTVTYTATNDFTGTFLLNSLTVNNTSGTVTVAGNALNFTGAAPAITVSGAGNLIISNPLTLSSTDATPNVTIGGGGGGDVTLSGAITGGTNNIIKTTSGKLTLSGGGTLNQISVQNGSLFITVGTLALTQPTDANNVPAGLQLGSATGQTVSATISGGATVNVTDNVYVGDIAGSTGTLTVTGAGTVLNLQGGTSNRLAIGNFGNGTLNITSGGVINTQRLFTPRQAGSTSTITIDGAGSILHITTQLAVASNGTGNMTIQNGGQLNIDAAAGFSMGINAPGAGTLTVTGTGSAINAASAFTMGAVATGSTSTLALVVQNGGTYTGGNSIFAAPNPGPTANITVTGTGSTLTTTGYFVLSGTAAAGATTPGTVGGTSTLTVGSGGSVTATTTGANLSIYAGGTVNINTGGTLSVTSIADGVSGSTGNVNVASGTILNITDGNYLNQASTSVGATYSGVIAGAGGVVKSGPGTQTLAGANTYSGGTTVTGGTLTITNAGALGTGSIAVGTGATLNATGLTLSVPANAMLSGAGTVTATTVSAGPKAIVRGGAPGTTGTLSITGNVTATGGAAGNGAEHTQVSVDNSTASLIAVTGQVNFVSPSGGDPFVFDIRSLSLTPNVSVTRTVVTATGGFFRNGTGPIPAGTNFTLGTDYVLSSPDFASFTGVSLGVTGTGSTLVLTFTPVPEPATVLGLAAVAGVVVRLRRKFA
jgi:T5SS/PEP-CTERM-associated repeat protein/autotransporter-associated beta strand protein